MTTAVDTIQSQRMSEIERNLSELSQWQSELSRRLTLLELKCAYSDWTFRKRFEQHDRQIAELQGEEMAAFRDCVCAGKILVIAISIILGAGSLGLGIELWKYWQVTTLSSITFITTGGMLMGIAAILTIFKFYTWYSGTDRTPNRTSRITGASLLASVRSDARTIAGACRILGISENQRQDKQLIEDRKANVLQVHNRALNKLLKADKKNLNGLEPTFSPATESPIMQAVRLMIEDAHTAYQTLISS